MLRHDPMPLVYRKHGNGSGQAQYSNQSAYVLVNESELPLPLWGVDPCALAASSRGLATSASISGTLAGKASAGDPVRQWQLGILLKKDTLVFLNGLLLGEKPYPDPGQYG